MEGFRYFPLVFVIVITIGIGSGVQGESVKCFACEYRDETSRLDKACLNGSPDKGSIIDCGSGKCRTESTTYNGKKFMRRGCGLPSEKVGCTDDAPLLDEGQYEIFNGRGRLCVCSSDSCNGTKGSLASCKVLVILLACLSAFVHK